MDCRAVVDGCLQPHVVSIFRRLQGSWPQCVEARRRFRVLSSLDGGQTAASNRDPRLGRILLKRSRSGSPGRFDRLLDVTVAEPALELKHVLYPADYIQGRPCDSNSIAGHELMDWRSSVRLSARTFRNRSLAHFVIPHLARYPSRRQQALEADLS